MATYVTLSSVMTTELGRPRDKRIDGAVLQDLEAADLAAELPTRLQVIDGKFVHRRHRADGLSAERRDRLVYDALDERQCRPWLAEYPFRADPYARERNLRGPQAILCRVAAA